MTHLLLDYYIEEIKSFDGYDNYLNASGYQRKLLIRKESLVRDEEVDFILSDIVDENDNKILSSYKDTLYLHSYEDPRFVTENKFTYCLCYFDKHTEIMGTKMGYCNTSTNNQDLYNFAKWEYEKNWQVNKDKIIYSIEPLEIYNTNFELVLKNKENKKWDYWIKKYGFPRLSTNIFTIQERHFVLFHSKNIICRFENASLIKDLAGELLYFCGLLEVTKDYIPISYCKLPLLPSFKNYKVELREEYIQWREKTNSTWRVDIFFPTNVEVQNDIIYIYGGINDCIASKIIVDTSYFMKIIDKADFIAL